MSPQSISEVLKSVFDAFNAHDLDRIMSYFSEDCVLEMPRGPDPWGRRSVPTTPPLHDVICFELR